MTHIVTDSCVKCKFTDCVDVCPVNCFYEGEFMLVINPDECIDCGVCVPECPVEAIKPESDGDIIWAERGVAFSKLWPRIEHSKKPMADAEAYKDEEGKFEKYVGE